MKNGTTSAGRTRWRCLGCGASTTITRQDITRRAELMKFHTWILGSSPQQAQPGAARSFREATAWCWNIPVPPPESTGQIHDVLLLDGTYLHDWCTLIASTGAKGHVLDWAAV